MNFLNKIYILNELKKLENLNVSKDFLKTLQCKINVFVLSKNRHPNKVEFYNIKSEAYFVSNFEYDTV